MRVLLVTDWCASPGGTENSTLWLRDALRHQGHDVRLLTSSVGSGGDEGADYLAYGTDRVAEQIGLQIYNPFAARVVRQAERDFRPDVAAVLMFEFHLSPAVILALRSTPVVAIVVNHKPICPSGLKRLPDGTLCNKAHGVVCLRSGCESLPAWVRDRPRYALIGAALARCRLLIACSRLMRDELALNGFESEVVPLPVPSPSPAHHRNPAPEPLLLFVGRLNPEKGVEVLLRGFSSLLRRFPDARLRIAGDGPLRGGLERLAGTLGVTGAVTFLGRLSPGRVESELERAWALVAPSLWPEPFGLVAGEAIVRGVPVVASAHGGFAETIEEGSSGLLFPNGNEAALTLRLERILSGQAFPGRSLPASAVSRARSALDIDRYTTVVAGKLSQAAGTAPLSPPDMP